MVKLLASQGHVVSVVGRRPPLERDRQIPRVRYWAVDLLNEEAINTALGEILKTNGKLNNLVLCQRYRGQDDDWQGNLETTLSVTRKIIEQLVNSFAAGSGNSIVAIGSIAGHYIAGEQSVGYHAAKAGLVQMVRYYAVVLGRKGIRVNCVSPGSIVREESRSFYAEHPEIIDLHRRITPLARMGTAREVAGVVDFLCSASASFVTGQDITVDGGVSLQGHEALVRDLTSRPHLGRTEKHQK